MLSCCLTQPLRQSTDLSIPHWMTTRLRMEQGCIFITLETSKVVTRFQSLRCWNQTAFIKCVQYFCIKILLMFEAKDPWGTRRYASGIQWPQQASRSKYDHCFMYIIQIYMAEVKWPVNGFIIPGTDRPCLYQTQNQRSMISDTSCTRQDILTLKSQAFIYTGSNDARQVPRLNLFIMRVLYVIKFLVDPREFFNYLNQVFYRAFLFHSTAVIDL